MIAETITAAVLFFGYLTSEEDRRLSSPSESLERRKARGA